MTEPILIDSPAFTVLADRWRHLTALSLIPRITPDEAAELASIPAVVAASLAAIPPQTHVSLHTFDADVPDDPQFVLARSLFATRSLHFAWLPPSHESPVKLTSPDGASRVYFRVTLAFYAWVRGTCRVEYNAKRWPLPPELDFAVSRVKSYICARHGITDDCPEKLPEPSDEFPE